MLLRIAFQTPRPIKISIPYATNIDMTKRRAYGRTVYLRLESGGSGMKMVPETTACPTTTNGTMNGAKTNAKMVRLSIPGNEYNRSGVTASL